MKKEEMKLLLFIDNMIVYERNQTELTKKKKKLLLEAIIVRLQDIRLIYMSITFLYICNEQL